LGQNLVAGPAERRSAIIEQKRVVAITPRQPGIVQHHHDRSPARRSKLCEVIQDARLVTQIQVLQRFIPSTARRLARVAEADAATS